MTQGATFDLFMSVIRELPQPRQQAAMAWLQLMTEQPDLFPFPQYLDDAAARVLIGLLKFLADEIAHAQ
jgi:hypothetical protein